MKTKTVLQIVNAMPAQMGDALIYQPFPSHALKQVDPFILLHHWGPQTYQPNNDAFSVAPHPHRGFEPVTFIFAGEVHHRDSMGNDSIIKEGGVQWMTAGKGVMHSETGTEDFHKKGGVFEIIQVWMNLPAKLKMTDPSYQGFQKKEIPTLMQDNGRVEVNITSGFYRSLRGPVKSITGIDSYTIRMKPGGKTTLEIASCKNAMFYLLDGSVVVNEKKLESGRKAVTFSIDGDAIAIEAAKESKILLLAGAPLNESVAQYGPFVMNTLEEVNMAIDDYNAGRMGILN